MRSGIPNLKFGNAHWAYSTEWCLVNIDGSGNNVNYGISTNFKYPCYCVPQDYSIAKIRHYTTKTLSEFLEQQYNRGSGDGTRPIQSIDKFLWYCEWNYDKMKYFYEWKKKHFIRPKSALVCVTNNEMSWIRRMVNAVNSVFFHCPDLIDAVHVYIIGSTSDIDMTGINPKIKYTTIEASQECSSLWNNYFDRSVFYKFEMFVNKIFREYDNIIYLDSDVECQQYIGEMFNCYHLPGLHFAIEVPEIQDETKTELGLVHQYNTGVMIITPSSISPLMDEMYHYMVSLCKEHPELRLPDQYAINLMIQKHMDLAH